MNPRPSIDRAHACAMRCVLAAMVAAPLLLLAACAALRPVAPATPVRAAKWGVSLGYMGVVFAIQLEQQYDLKRMK